MDATFNVNEVKLQKKLLTNQITKLKVNINNHVIRATQKNKVYEVPDEIKNQMAILVQQRQVLIDQINGFRNKTKQDYYKNYTAQHKEEIKQKRYERLHKQGDGVNTDTDNDNHFQISITVEKNQDEDDDSF